MSGDSGRPRLCRSGERYSDWGSSLKQRPECRLDLPDTTTCRGIWTAKMQNSTVCRVLDGLFAARASGSRQPDDMNEILRYIPPRRVVLPIPGPARGSPRVDETFPRTGLGTAAAPTRDDGRDSSTIARQNREPAAKQIPPGRRGTPGSESRTVLPAAQVSLNFSRVGMSALDLSDFGS